MIYKNYNLSLNIKAIIFFEHISGHSFLKMTGTEDLLLLAYCGFIYSNNLKLTYDAFKFLVEDKKFGDWVVRKMEDEVKYVQQYMKAKEDDKPEQVDNVPTITQKVNYLLANGIDINYVMDKMELWELSGLLEAIQQEKKNKLEEDRLWTYVGMLPLMDSKKVKSPSDLLPFPWEKENRKNKAKQDLEAKKQQILQFFKQQEEARKQNGTN